MRFQEVTHVCYSGPQNISATKARLDSALLEAVDYGLMVLGETVRKTIYECLGNRFELERGEIPERLRDFHKALEHLFGAKAYLIERLIARNLYHRFDLYFAPQAGWTLIEYVERARSILENHTPGFDNDARELRKQ